MDDMAKLYAFVDKNYCVACGACEKECPISAIKVMNGIAAEVDMTKCVGCGKCAKICPASVIEIRNKNEEMLYQECSLSAKSSGGCPMCRELAQSVPYTPVIPFPKRKNK